MLSIIKSSWTLKNIFYYLNDSRKFNLIVYNKELQNRLNINITDFKRYSGKYVIGDRNGKIKEYIVIMIY